MSYAFNAPHDHWLAKATTCSKAGLIHLVETLAFIYQIPREEMLTYVNEADSHGRFIDSLNRHKRFALDPDAYELRRLQKQTRALKSKLKKKKGAA